MEQCALSTVQYVGRSGMFCDPYWSNEFLKKAGDLIAQYLDDWYDEMYGTATIQGVTYNYYINDNPPSDDEEDWVQVQVWLEVSPKIASVGMANIGTLAWHRTTWEDEIKPMFNPDKYKERPSPIKL